LTVRDVALNCDEGWILAFTFGSIGTEGFAGKIHTPPKPGAGTSPPPATKKLGHQHAAFPLPEGDVSLSFPAELSVASAQMMASFVKLLLEQAERQAKARESAPPQDEAAN
jgi:hypothetical protein